MAKTESHFGQVLSEIFAGKFRKDNQQKCLKDCLKARSNKNEVECKKCVCKKFYASKIMHDFYP